jgi:hypothetical protein
MKNALHLSLAAVIVASIVMGMVGLPTLQTCHSRFSVDLDGYRGKPGGPSEGDR